MRNARMLGNCAEYLAHKQKISSTVLCQNLGCSENELLAFWKGRRNVSFAQLTTIASVLGVTVTELLEGNSDHYEESVVHCMNNFSDSENREKILDLIDDYMDILDAVNDNLLN